MAPPQTRGAQHAMSDQPSDAPDVLSSLNDVLQRIETKLEQQESLYQVTNYLLGTVAAIDFVLKRMMASHVEAMPYGVISRFLAEEETLLASISAHPDLPEDQRQIMVFHLKMMLKDVRKFVEQTQQAPPPTDTQEPG
jgi:hypothetical protein